MKRMRIAAAVATVSMLALAACSGGGTSNPTTGDATTGSNPTTNAAANSDKTITLWLAGSDTPDELRQYLIDTFHTKTGATLKIEEQSWSDLVTKLTTALPDAENTPDVVEIGNTQAPTFTAVGAFLPLTDIYKDLGGDDLLKSFVDAGTYDGTVFAVPYYFGSRYIFYRPDIWKAAGVEVPTTLQGFTDAATKLTTDKQSGFAMGGQDWRNGISWVFANGGELATVDGTTWTSTLSDPKTIKGLEMWQDLVEHASLLPHTERDVAYWDFLNDGTDGSAPQATSIMAPGWARWSLGDMTKNDKGEEVRDGMKDESKFDIFALPGVDGGVAPVFAGGSNIAISAKSQNPELAKELMKIIFSEDYQKMLGKNGLGPANTKYTSSLGDDKFAKTMIETAEHSKLTPAAPGWAAIEGAFVYEELFQKIADGGDVTALAKEYDAKLTPMLNGN